MKYNITYRQMRNEDFDQVVALQNATWGIDQILGKNLGKEFSELYIAGTLANSTRQIVAEHEGKVVGVVMTKYPANFTMISPSSRDYVQREQKIMQMPYGNELIRTFHGIHDAYASLIIKSPNRDRYDGYLSFLALNSKMRGAGIGKGLMYLAQEYLKSSGATMLFLYTDTTSNYGFYDHLGFQRSGSQKKQIEWNKKQYSLDIYLYDYDLWQEE